MIKLELEDYCQNCTEFEAHTDTLFADEKAIFTVRCEHKFKCENLTRSFIKEFGKDIQKKEEYELLLGYITYDVFANETIVHCPYCNAIHKYSGKFSFPGGMATCIDCHKKFAL